MDDQNKSVSRSVLQFLSGTSLSRLTGLFREVSLAYFFGATPAFAAFLIAYRFANLMRRLFGEGALLAGFSPHFEEIRARSPQKASLFFKDLFYFLVFILSAVILAAEGILYLFWKYADISPDTAHIIYLTMLMLPGALFICLYALFGALLQCEKKYFLPAVAPILFNIVILICTWLVKDLPQVKGTIGLSLGVVIAFFFQWVVVVPMTLSFLKKDMGWKSWLQPKIFSSDLSRMMRAIFLTVLGVGAVQINAALDAIFARYASLSGPAYLNYAIRLYQLPLGLFGIAFASAILPPLSRYIQKGEMEKFRSLLKFSLLRTFSLMVFCTVATFVLGSFSVNLVYGRGGFSSVATLETIICLWGYAVGLIPSVFVLILAPAFYAQKDYYTPFRASVYTVLINIGLNLLMLFALNGGSASIALATSLAELFNCFYLFKRLSKKNGQLIDLQTVQAAIKVVAVVVLAGGICCILSYAFIGDLSLAILGGSVDLSFPRVFQTQLVQFASAGFLFLALVLGFAWILRVQEILVLTGLKIKKGLKLYLD